MPDKNGKRESSRERLGSLTTEVFVSDDGTFHVEHKTEFAPRLVERQETMSRDEKLFALQLKQKANIGAADFFAYVDDPEGPVELMHYDS